MPENHPDMAADAARHAQLIELMDGVPDTQAEPGDAGPGLNLQAATLTSTAAASLEVLADRIVRGAVATAMAEVGSTEADYRPIPELSETAGKNKTRYHRDLYPQVNRQKGEGWQWCALFVTWCYWRQGVDLRRTIPFAPSCSSWIDTAKEYGAWGRRQRPDAGDPVLYGDSSDLGQHIGLSISGGWQPTVEGNTTSGVSGIQSDGGGVFVRHRGDPPAWATGSIDMRRLLVALHKAGKIDLTAAAEAARWTWRPATTTVEAVQRALNDLRVRVLAIGGAWTLPALDVDGSYGPATQAAARAAQQIVGVDVDGKPGPATLAAIATYLQSNPLKEDPTMTPDDLRAALQDVLRDPRTAHAILTAPIAVNPADPDGPRVAVTRLIEEIHTATVGGGDQ